MNDILSFSDKYDNHTLLSLIASAETRSEHPLGKAIVAYAKDQNITLIETTNFQMEAGKGIYAEINNKKIFCGNEKYLKEKRIFILKHIKEVLDKFRNEGKASILASVNDECVGMITLSDILRPTAQNMITQLKNMGTDIILLTGDNQKTAEYFAKQVNITNIKSELLPAEKVKNIQKLQKEEKYVCMIGDGVNDAPALKTANVGVAMGSMGSDIAIEAADIALMSDDITKIPYLKRLSNATVKTIKFSIALSLLINFVAITLSLLGMLTPTTGALVHNAGSVFVVLIAALLYDRKFE